MFEVVLGEICLIEPESPMKISRLTVTNIDLAEGDKLEYKICVELLLQMRICPLSRLNV